MGAARELTEDEMLLWQSLGRLAHALPRVLEDDMTRATGLSMTEFAVLLSLSQTAEHQLRMAQLATATGLTPSSITRIVDRLVGLGLVDKKRFGSDARGAVATMTDVGQERFDAARPSHTAIAQRRVLDHVAPELVAVVAEVLDQLTSVTARSRISP